MIDPDPLSGHETFTRWCQQVLGLAAPPMPAQPLRDVCDDVILALLVAETERTYECGTFPTQLIEALETFADLAYYAEVRRGRGREACETPPLRAPGRRG